MRSAAVFFLLAQMAFSFVLPLKRRAAVTEQAEVLTLRDTFDWTTTVIVGTPGKAFTVQIDTTSSLLIIPDVSSGRNNSFDPSKSSTYIKTNYYFSQNSQDWVGSIGNDTLGQSFSNDPSRTSITVPFATFGLAGRVPQYLEDDVDGVLGLAFPAFAPDGSTPVFQTAINQNNVAIGTFVIWLEDQWETSDNGTEGVIYYGNVDNLHCKVDQRKMYPLSSATYFQFTTPSFTSGNYTFNKKGQAIVSSLSPFISLPSPVLQSVLRQLNVNPYQPGPFPVPCDTKIDIAFNFASGSEHVTELNLLMEGPDGSCYLALIYTTTDPNASPEYMLGTPFLRGRCTYFDVANQYIGFSEPLTHGGHNSL